MGDAALRKAIINAGRGVCKKQSFLNCHLFVQLTSGVPQIQSLPKVSGKPKVGDILRWHSGLHYAIYLGNNERLEVPEWGNYSKPQIIPLLNEVEEDPWETVYRPDWKKETSAMRRDVAQLCAEAALITAFDPGHGGKDFFDVFQKKGKWFELSIKDLVKNPKFADDLFYLLSVAYKDIGGHLRYKKPADLFDGRLVFEAIDVDDDPQSDAVKILKNTPGGLKSVGMGHDGGGKAIDVVKKLSVKHLKTRGYYAEMRGAIAHIMLTRHNIKSIDDPKVVGAVLKGKTIEWVGLHPKGKYPDNPGWYWRKIGGKRVMKIMLGMPLQSR